MRGARKIAFFLPSLMGGGAEKVMLNLGRGMLEKGIVIDMVLAQATGEYLDKVPPGIRIVDLKCKRTLSALPRLVRYLKGESPSVLLSAIEHANLIALWACRLAGVPTRAVITLHTDLAQASLNGQSMKGRLIPMLARLCYPYADEIVAVSQGVSNSFSSLLHLPPERIRVIYNPVVTPEIFVMAREKVDHPWIGDKPLVLALGRLSDQKDYDTLIRSFARVVEKASARLLILGEGEDRSRIERLVQDFGLSEVVSLPGFVQNPYAYMSKASVVVLSSRAEGLPTVLIEALALGVPIVSTDCRSGPDEILMGGKFGTLVPVGDVAALSEGILGALKGPQKVFDRKEALGRFEESWAVDEYLRVMQPPSTEPSAERCAK